jgi:hypothetical protein
MRCKRNSLAFAAGMLLVYSTLAHPVRAAGTPVDAVRDASLISFQELSAQLMIFRGLFHVPEVETNLVGGSVVIPKETGTLDIDFSFITTNFPDFPVLAAKGTALDDQTIQWSVEESINDTFEIEGSNETFVLYVRDVEAKLTAHASFTNAFYDSISESVLNVRLDRTGGDPENHLVIEGNMDWVLGIAIEIVITNMDFYAYSGGPTGDPPAMAEAAKTSGGFEFSTANLVSNAPYRILSATNLADQNWTTVATFTNDTDSGTQNILCTGTATRAYFKVMQGL